MALPEHMPVKPYQVHVEGYGFGGEPFYVSSRGKALSQAFQSCAFEGWTFKQFLKRANARICEPHPRFGEKITVGSDEAYIVCVNSQYIKFVRPGSDLVLNTHPLDVEPPEARRGTPYYVGEPA